MTNTLNNIMPLWTGLETGGQGKLSSGQLEENSVLCEDDFTASELRAVEFG